MAAGEHDIHNIPQNRREKTTLSVLCGCTAPVRNLPQQAAENASLFSLGCCECSVKEGLKAQGFKLN